MKQGEIWMIENCFQIRSVSETRLLKQIGQVSFSEILLIQKGIAKVLGY